MIRKKVLLAEDDNDDQVLFNYFLQDRQDIFLMPMVENGVELLEKLDEIEVAGDLPDLIILDQNMPKRNGLQTLHLLKENPKYASIPVMMYSTYIDPNLIELCAGGGAASLRSKPITAAGYEEMINDFLKAIP